MEATRVVFGALLHDIGKLIHRSIEQDARAHQVSGSDFLRDFTQDEQIIESVAFHHRKDIIGARIANDSPAYITYIADNISAASDRRDQEKQGTEGKYEGSGFGFNKSRPLDSIFNLINDGKRKDKFPLRDLSAVVYPDASASADQSIYNGLFNSFRDALKALRFDDKKYLNSLLELMEATLSFIPSSTRNEEVADISLYDHSKITAALASCIYAYLADQERMDFKQELLDNERKFYNENAFLMFSCDISGIQPFIYTIASSGALKSLRSRSFYLEIMMENFIDDILDELDLTRANLIYSGGGHCYILLPNIESVKEKLDDVVAKANKWLREIFRTGLFFACAYVKCSGADLMNMGGDSNISLYREIFRKLSSEVSAIKMNRYTADDIIGMNSMNAWYGERECRVCGTVSRLGEDDEICDLCSQLIAISSKLVTEDNMILITSKIDEPQIYLELPSYKHGTSYMMTADRAEANRFLKSHDDILIRSYGKNDMYTGFGYSARLWMGTYHTHSGSSKNDMASFEQLAAMSKGIDRIAVLRADVDDLGSTFIRGFERSEGDRFRYVTISRYATLSRQMSLFFKKNINEIFNKATLERFQLDEGMDNGPKRVTIVYSGGDDLFVVGAWNEVLEAAVDLYKAFKVMTGGALTFSAGIGIYDSDYPISRIAEEVAELESQSKNFDPEKNAVSIFSGDGGQTYKWNVFIDVVIGEKFRLLQKYFSIIKVDDSISQAIGNSFLYKLLDFLRNADDRINIARCAYLLGRLAPSRQTTEASPDASAMYSEFSKKVYGWLLDPVQRKQLITAISIYVYLYRTRSPKEE
ncbi:MAG: type III-A CRISPR-associated protein Cas10/Csm1 [Saccharofermentanales bacterium]